MAARLNIQRTGDGGVEQLQLKPGNNKLRVVPGRTFNLQDPDGQPIDPSQLRVLQVDNDLIIENIPVEGSTETASVTLEGYYQVCSATDRCTVSVGGEDAAVAQGAEGQENLGTTENSQATVLADVSTKPLGALSDGTFVLYDTGFQAPEQPATEEFPIRPVLYGAGGLAVVALAAGGGGGGGDPSGAPNLGDVPLALKSATSFNNRFPTISGTAKPGTVVTLRLDTDNDQRENVTYSATADANGNWSVNLQSAKPATGNLPATGLSDSNTLEVSGALDGVQGAALPVVTLTYDNTPPASAEIAAVSGDNIITAAEKTAGVAVSGTAEANGTVELKIGGTTKLVAVDAEGKWNTTLSAAELPAADGQYAASEKYGVVDGVIEEDSIDVTATLQGGVITDVSVTGHPLLTQSHDYMQGFVNEISGAVVGRSVEDAHVTALAGASKTSNAFNDAIDDIASQAARAAAASGS